MRAVVVREHGGLEALRHEEVEPPRVGAGDVLVEVRACGVNHLDVWVRRGVPGHRFPLPLIPGNDVAGVVREAGSGVVDVQPGKPVVVAPGLSCGECEACRVGHEEQCARYGILGETRDGGYAELIAVPRANVLDKPDNLSFEEAAAVGIPFLTAWHMLVARARLQRGETVLVQAGGSGVGSAAIQIARMLDATVITTAGSDAKLRRALELGAHHGINYGTADVAKEVKRLTHGAGADVVVEHVGAASWEGSLRSLAWHGRLVTCGATTGAEVKVNLRHLFFKSQSLLGSTMGNTAELREVLEHTAAGRLHPVLDRVLPLAEAGEAHRLLEERRVFGKVVLRL